MSLRTRLLVGLAVLVLAAVATAGWSVLAVARAKLQEAEDSRAHVVGGALAALVERACAGGCDKERVTAMARTLVAGGALPELVIVDRERRLLAAEGDARATSGVADPGLNGALAGVGTVGRSGDAVYYYAPLRDDGRVAGAARLRMPGDTDISRALHDARALLVGVTLIDGGLVLVFGVLFIRRVVEPIEALSGAAQRVAAGELDLPPLQRDPARTDEVARLVDDFNRMTASLRRQREQMVAQDKLVTVGRLAAGVAHEIGNPLAAVLGYVDLLLHDEPPSSAQRDTLERIRKETDRIRVIVADLLDYARPVTGTVEAVRLPDLVEAALTLLRPQARFRDVEVAQSLPVDLPSASASASRLTQVLLNLLLNAADAMAGRGTVTLTARRDEDEVVLHVGDSGPGVASEDRARIFDPFFTTKEPGKGTGLGLSISRQLVEAYGGSLVLLSSESERRGAEFVLRLPIWRETAMILRPR
ncbi:MAG TPA: HAMP domain-containing sensor histidine kinase [Polyangia bacterium]|nr:HAMP domain-containing sensor histidine kinase [Polyangia bacterium]